jgi:hypothetical protein
MTWAIEMMNMGLDSCSSTRSGCPRTTRKCGMMPRALLRSGYFIECQMFLAGNSKTAKILMDPIVDILLHNSLVGDVDPWMGIFIIKMIS